MKKQFFFISFYILYTKGNITECDSFEGTKLKCIFSQNINFTKTNFTVFFYSEKGHEELLADCGWVGDKLQCLTQEGFECKQPVSETAEISVPTQFVSRPGTYRCIADDSGHEGVKPCRLYEQENRPEEFRESLNETSSNSKVEQNSPGKIVGGVLGAVAFVILVSGLVIVAACKNCYSQERPEETESELFTVNEREELSLTPVT